MNQMKILAGCLVLIGGNAIALTGEEATTEVIAQEKAWSDAVIHHDTAKVASILAADFIGVDGRGFVTDKAAELKEAEPPAADSRQPHTRDAKELTCSIVSVSHCRRSSTCRSCPSLNPQSLNVLISFMKDKEI